MNKTSILSNKLLSSILIGLAFFAFMFVSVEAKQSFADLELARDTTILSKTEVSTTGINSIQRREEIKSGNFVSYTGQSIMLRELARNNIELRVNGVSAETNLSITAETDSAGRTRIKAMMENGQEREVMIMPDVASEVALEQVRSRVCSTDNDCTLELKSVGRESEEKIQYEMELKQDSKIFGLFKKEMMVTVDVDAQTGESRVHRPWWSFVAVVQAEN